ncbi:MAG: 16S rRNA (cytosine(1402)-N(4))-methyltransferase RsmH [Erysipelotrichales bacterium]|nr:16S rRNA (cytosine(1402)-N(4))-methyltransferase RsmH [Erysipelotrichales bacterium]
MHKSVLLEEAINALAVKKDGLYVDCTLGMGGHSGLIVKSLVKGHLYCFEQDQEAIMIASEKLKFNNVTIINNNFRHIKEELNKLGVTKVDGILYDLGVSSLQFDKAERGFSYRFDAPLDMRMNQSDTLSAKTIVNEYSFSELLYIFRTYGEEKFAKEIARNIEKKRQLKSIETTFELVEIIKEVLPAKVKNEKGHPAKKVFQSLRIAVNDELKAFEDSLKAAVELLNKDGRLVVITFHSLEDRICKQFFNEKSTVFVPKNLPIKKAPQADFKVITKKPILPGTVEISDNNRSHSAKMRILSRN